MGTAGSLTLSEIQAELRQVHYRPGWTFTASQHEHEGTWLRIIAPVPNAYQPEQTVDLGIDSPLPPFDSTLQLHRWLIWRIERIESHEAREFYRVGDSRPFDPHAA